MFFAPENALLYTLSRALCALPGSKIRRDPETEPYQLRLPRVRNKASIAGQRYADNNGGIRPGSPTVHTSYHIAARN